MMAFTDLLRLDKCLETINSSDFATYYKELIETELDEYKKYPADQEVINCITDMMIHLDIFYKEGACLSSKIAMIKEKINTLSSGI